MAVALAAGCAGPTPEQEGASGPTEEPARVYHVQLDMTKDKETANQYLSKAIAWWGRQPSERLPAPAGRADDSAVQVVWQAPLYRIRLGPFPSRSAAKQVLSAARSAYPGAFIVPEQRRPAP
jgi:cell division septation protein DedD